ncbi:putative RNA polymerase sigma-70 region 3, RNA polymerase sigma-70 region 2 [Helianthus annuus]|nr:putative RNA polymerase sigma-70 region 3, RNA polymerase sigma-70 region 2 [Helianthus annuus]KAJ0649690.1 putative RNA polymerase sigma-70 region 3, RNA polymerase sigma-70 region 2 [Helianthus annuus]KAJ0845949.1 putative RNA polymerase sigma-70 region 3, RNA polymerase sigma-70 region 2 [Helianthus annuus]
MMCTTTIGLRTGNGLLGSSYFYSDTTEKLSCRSDTGFTVVFTKNVITAKKSSKYNRHTKALKALKDHAATASSPSSCTDQWVQILECEGSKNELSIDALLSLQKSLLEKQWNISTEKNTTTEKNSKKMHVTGSQTSARKRRIDAREKIKNSWCATKDVSDEHLNSTIGTELLQNQFKGHVKGVKNEVLLTHSEVTVLSKKIKIGLLLEEQKSRLKKKLGYEPSEEQLATSMKITRTDLRTRQIECNLARQKLTLSNVRLVMSIAQKYDNMGAQMADLIQGGLIGLLRGIEKYDSSRGFKISTYVYWWIRQGVSRTLMENSKILRLPTHLHERQSAIRNAKMKLEEQGINPSLDRIAESLNISRKKVLNATQATTKVFSLDRGAFPSVSGCAGQTLDNDIADNCMENDPWHGVSEKALKDEVNKLITVTLGERERHIIRLYYGLDNECLTWEDIGKRIGLSREGVRQIGLVALEKLKHAARNTRLGAMLVEY